MDLTALHTLSYGMYIIGTKDGVKNVGCVVNTVTQSTSNPVTLTVCIHKDNYTNVCIKKTKAFCISVLTEKTPTSVIGTFGFSSSREKDKFAEVAAAETAAGLPYVDENSAAYLQCRVLGFTDHFTHTIFIAEVEDAVRLSGDAPMTYRYYHSVVKGKTAKNAPTFMTEKLKPGRVCGICGYRYPDDAAPFDALPESYVCPVCGAPKSKFTPFATEGENKKNNKAEDFNMANLKGTKTERNLAEAFAGESQARNKYTYFAGKARKEGYEQIAAIFEETAGNEKEHAKIWFKLLCGGEIPATVENLKAAAGGEKEEWTQMYKHMAEEARAEGFNDIAFLFEKVGMIEKEHEERYLALLKNVESGTVFAKKEKSVWICRNCGHIVDNISAPTTCPVCAHPQAYFELRVISY